MAPTPPPRPVARAVPPLLTGPVTPVVRAVAGMAGLLGLYGIYSLVAYLQARDGVTLHELPTPIDAWVPLTPAAVLLYLWLIPQALIPLAIVEDRRVLFRGALAYLTLTTAGLPFWLLWPVTVPRDPVAVVDLFTWGLAITRWIDPPTNCFPSMHVAASFLAARIVQRCDPALGRWMLAAAAGITWSTLALDQHWLLDGVAGLALALVVDAVAFGWRPLPPDCLRAGPRHRLVWIVGLYLALIAAAGLPWWMGWVPHGDLGPTPWSSTAPRTPA